MPHYQLTVTEEHKRKADQQCKVGVRICSCLLWQAFHDAGFPIKYVGPVSAAFNPEDKIYMVNLPDPLMDLVTAYDAGKTPALPLTFEIDLPEEVLNANPR